MSTPYDKCAWHSDNEPECDETGVLWIAANGSATYQAFGLRHVKGIYTNFSQLGPVRAKITPVSDPIILTEELTELIVELIRRERRVAR